MKNIVTLVTPDEINRFVYNLWQTDEFRNSHKLEGHYINQIVAKFCKEPRFFAEMTNPDVEWSHFTAWMNLIYRREEFYKNPAISDLYYLHEIYHIITMHYDASLSFEDWSLKMWNNERSASIQSEVEVYFALPTLREKSFSFEIWADRLLTSKSLLHPEILDNRKYYQNNKLEFQFRLQLLRSAAMIHPTEGDEIEKVIANYATSNIHWFHLWKSKFSIIEGRLYRFKFFSTVFPDSSAEELREWYKLHTNTICPFEDEAIKFAEILKQLKSSHPMSNPPDQKNDNYKEISEEECNDDCGIHTANCDGNCDHINHQNMCLIYGK